ncbi:MAG: six-hairpin glycosidase, partial [Bacteroidaceae bacterium]|nr:six-hairpin glycosidase [Bacteroidaceae bacterium]
MKNILYILVTFFALLSFAVVEAQDRIHYTGAELSNPTHHDGQLSPVVGVHAIQVMRANREYPTPENGYGWTYNHQPMLAYWNGKFYMHYLSDPQDEHVPPSQTFLMTSEDGYRWTAPQTLFPIYRVPDGFTKEG